MNLKILFRFKHLDKPLITSLLVLSAIGLIILYTASAQHLESMIRQVFYLFLGFGLMLIFAQFRTQYIVAWVPFLYISTLLLLVGMSFFENHTIHHLGLSLSIIKLWYELPKLTILVVPMMVSWCVVYRYESDDWQRIHYERFFEFIAVVTIAVPVFLMVKQSDFGTAFIVASSGIFILILAGRSWCLVFGSIAVLLWISAISNSIHSIHYYSRGRGIYWNTPSSISQQIMDSISLYGKGWLSDTLFHYHLVTERSTYFVLAFYSDQFGLLGIIVLLSLYFFILLRAMLISFKAQNQFALLLAASLSFSFFIQVLVNISLVFGSEMYVRLPLISYGGISIPILMIGFGLILASKK